MVTAVNSQKAANQVCVEHNAIRMFFFTAVKRSNQVRKGRIKRIRLEKEQQSREEEQRLKLEQQKDEQRLI